MIPSLDLHGLKHHEVEHVVARFIETWRGKDLFIDIRGFGETNLIKTRRKAFTPSNIFKTIEANLKKQSPYKYQFSMPFNILFINCWKGKT